MPKEGPVRRDAAGRAGALVARSHHAGTANTQYVPLMLAAPALYRAVRSARLINRRRGASASPAGSPYAREIARVGGETQIGPYGGQVRYLP
jgi:hypothetical protein